MKLQFDPDLPHQRHAIDAVVRLFTGQIRIPVAKALTSGGVVANRLDLDGVTLLRRVQAVQAASGLTSAETLHGLPGIGGGQFPNYSVEMETGTGKTYVYLRTALELAARHGLRKYVIVVPSLAIREGVMSTFAATQSHFGRLYPRLQVRFARYDPRRMDEVREFAQSGAVAFLVVTLDGLNKQSNLVHRPNDRLQGRAPLELLQATRPILILDEPQNMESPRSRETLAALNPCFALRYSATHRHHYALVHRLGPRQAQADALVKQIRIVGGLDHEDRSIAWSRRIEETIRVHLEHQRKVRARGVKVLSLFFIDKVADYVGVEAVLPSLFDRHFEGLSQQYPVLAGLTGPEVRAAYFAQRGERAVDSRSGKTEDDEMAYRLIMQAKERLLSFDEPVSFIFSHSALREGWDNPNVFQICSLTTPKSSIKKRQEIGRGMRLAVDQSGRRVGDPDVNVLTLLVGEDHGQWWREFQAEQAREVESVEGFTPAEEGSESVSWVELDEADVIERALALLQRPASFSGSSMPPQKGDDDGRVLDHVQRLLRGYRPPLLVPRRFVAAVLRGSSTRSSADQVSAAIATVLHELLKLP